MLTEVDHYKKKKRIYRDIKLLRPEENWMHTNITVLLKNIWPKHTVIQNQMSFNKNCDYLII